MKKKLALITALLLCMLCAVSCSQSDTQAPDGMKSATLPGEPFILYVPESWSLNTSGGISGAYYNSASKILVSARYYTPDDPNMTLNQYVDFCSSHYGESLTDYTVTSREATLLGGENAVKLAYRITDGDSELTCFQITAACGGDFISLNGYCASALYEARSADYDSIVKEFVLCEKSSAQGTPVTDKNTPDGFQIASADHIEYRLYVPNTWICDAESGASEAYYPESGKSNVSVTSYAPSTSVGIQDYFAECEKEYQKLFSDYERLSEEARTVAGRSAYSYTYRLSVDGREMKLMQTLLIYNDMIYSVTYTALSENFDLHLEDVQAILNVFDFR